MIDQLHMLLAERRKAAIERAAWWNRVCEKHAFPTMMDKVVDHTTGIVRELGDTTNLLGKVEDDELAAVLDIPTDADFDRLERHVIALENGSE